MQKYFRLVNEQCAKHGWSANLLPEEQRTINLYAPFGRKFGFVKIAKNGRYLFVSNAESAVVLAGKGAIAEATRSVILANTLPV